MNTDKIIKLASPQLQFQNQVSALQIRVVKAERISHGKKAKKGSKRLKKGQTRLKIGEKMLKKRRNKDFFE